MNWAKFNSHVTSQDQLLCGLLEWVPCISASELSPCDLPFEQNCIKFAATHFSVWCSHNVWPLSLSCDSSVRQELKSDPEKFWLFACLNKFYFKVFSFLSLLLKRPAKILASVLDLFVLLKTLQLYAKQVTNSLAILCKKIQLLVTDTSHSSDCFFKSLSEDVLLYSSFT